MSTRGIELEQLPFTVRSKPEVFMSLKLALAQGRLRLLDHKEALRELRMLQSKRTSGGHYSISAPRGAHDDFACVIALLAHRGKQDASCRAYLSRNGVGYSAGERTHPAENPRLWPRKTNL